MDAAKSRLDNSLWATISKWALIVSLFGVLGSISNLPPAIKIGVASAIFILVPLAIGSALWAAVFGRLKDPEISVQLFSGWTLGLILIAYLAIVASALGLQWLVKQIPWLTVGAIAILAILGALRKGEADLILKTSVSKLSPQGWFTLGALFLLSLVPKAIGWIGTPYPLPDYNFSTPSLVAQPAERMLQWGFLSLVESTNLPPVVIITAVVSAISGLEPMSFVWAAPIPGYIIFVSGVGVFAYKVSHSRIVALISAFLAIFILTGVHATNNTAMNFKSNAFLYFLYPWALSVMLSLALEVRNEARRATIMLATGIVGCLGMAIAVYLPTLAGLNLALRPLLLGLVSSLFGLAALSLLRRGWLSARLSLFLIWIGIVFISIHTLEALLFIVPLGVFGALVASGDIKTVRILAYIVMVIVMLWIYAQWIGLVDVKYTDPISSLAFGNRYVVQEGFDFKFGILKFTTPLVFWLAAAVAAYVLVINFSRINLALVGTAVSVLAIFFYPDTLTFRGIQALAPIVAIILPLGFLNLLKWIGQFLPTSELRTLTNLLFIVIFLSQIPSVTRPFWQYHTTPLLNNEHRTVLKDYELEAVIWLRSNTEAADLIFSDYVSMFVLLPLANRTQPITKQQESFELSKEEEQKMLTLKERVFSTDDPHTSACSLLSLANSPHFHPEERQFANLLGGKSPNVYVLISPRSLHWVQQPSIAPEYFASTFPEAPDYKGGLFSLKPFHNSQFYQVIHSVQGKLYVLRLVLSPEACRQTT